MLVSIRVDDHHAVLGTRFDHAAVKLTLALDSASTFFRSSWSRRIPTKVNRRSCHRSGLCDDLDGPPQIDIREFELTLANQPLQPASWLLD